MSPMIGPNGLDSRHLHADPTCHMDMMHRSLLLFFFGFFLNFTWSHLSSIEQFAVVDNIDPALKPSCMKRWCFVTNLLFGLMIWKPDSKSHAVICLLSIFSSITLQQFYQLSFSAQDGWGVHCASYPSPCSALLDIVTGVVCSLFFGDSVRTHLENPRRELVG